MEIVKLKPTAKDYIWGGETLKKWGKESDSSKIAETWELSFNAEGPCYIASGLDEGKALKDVATEEDLGEAPSSFPMFPVLIKLIDAESNLSVQVHPSDDYALSHEGQYGKTEMWRVISAKKGSGLYVGFKKEYTEEEVREALLNGTILNLLCFHEVAPGDVFFLSSGTVHAIGAGVTLIEIQQNSTLTYRLYDYGRLGKDGKPRELHVEKALKVLRKKPYERPTFPKGVLGETKYFSVREKRVQGREAIEASRRSFLSFTVVEGEGMFAGLKASLGDTFFVPAGKKASFEGNATLVLTEVK